MLLLNPKKRLRNTWHFQQQLLHAQRRRELGSLMME
jgi:hypothetical protein